MAVNLAYTCDAERRRIEPQSNFVINISSAVPQIACQVTIVNAFINLYLFNTLVFARDLARIYTTGIYGCDFARVEVKEKYLNLFLK